MDEVCSAAAVITQVIMNHSHAGANHHSSAVHHVMLASRAAYAGGKEGVEIAGVATSVVADWACCALDLPNLHLT